MIMSFVWDCSGQDNEGMTKPRKTLAFYQEESRGICFGSSMQLLPIHAAI